MTAVTYDKPLPEITPLTQPFWEAAKRHELHLQKCKRCRNYQWYPRYLCSHCGSRNMEWKKVGGKGRVYSFTIIRQVVANSPAFQRDIPFVVALIELNEGPRMYSNIIGCKPEDVRVGMNVEVVFDDVTNDISLPKFKPATQKRRAQ